ncbi:MAG TPA: ABC transporter substrate-binding protein [Gaiellaceae bacterium]|nr:ABC transporter substrate-binding protein [Gaiellaceae bacterium]
MNGRDAHDDQADSPTLNRRDLLKLGAGGVLTATLAGTLVEGSVAATGGGKEAPQLAALVRQGKLPPLAKRLPAKPVVVQTVERLGRYGGTWDTAGAGAEDVGSWILLTIFYENVVAFRPPWKGNGSIKDAVPNLAKSITYNRAGTEYTIRLRSGIKWSDGAPLTAADIVFAVKDIILNKTLSPSTSTRFTGRGGEPVRIEQLDKWTVKLIFPTPNALFLQGMCSAGGYVLCAPAHYLKRFHQDFNPNVADLVKEANQPNWRAFFNSKNFPFDPNRPTVAAWKFTTPFGVGAQVVAERNPYYWKVDRQGRQLPYIDKVVYNLASDPEVVLAQGLNGQLDLHARLINTPRNKPVLAANRKKGNYKFFEVKTSFMNQGLIMLNQTAQDPVLRHIFRNKEFRKALSHAINRREIINSVYAGQGEPWQAAPARTSPWFNLNMAKQFTEFNMNAANQILDRAGFQRRGSSRVGPDGKAIEFSILAATTNPDHAQALEFIKRTWNNLGIDIQVQNVAENLFHTRVTSNAHHAAIFGASGGDNPILYPASYIPTSARASNYATLWALWSESNGRLGEAPPQVVRDQLTLYAGLKGTTQEKTQFNLMARILRGVAKEFHSIGIALPPPSYGIVKNNFHNVPKSIPGNLAFPGIGPVHPEQFFIQ